MFKMLTDVMDGHRYNSPSNYSNTPVDAIFKFFRGFYTLQSRQEWWIIGDAI